MTVGKDRRPFSKPTSARTVGFFTPKATMHTLTPADCFAVTIAAGISLYVGYRGIMWLADRVIDALTGMTRHED